MFAAAQKLVDPTAILCQLVDKRKNSSVSSSEQKDVWREPESSGLQESEDSGAVRHLKGRERR